MVATPSKQLIILNFNWIVFGFFQDSFTGVEQKSGYTVQVGYQKGAQVDAQDLEFTVVTTDVTASKLIMPLDMVWCWSWVTTGTGKGSNLDYTVNTTNVVSPFRTPTPPDGVEFILNVDNIALESNEIFSLRLDSSNTNLPTGEGVFFLDTLNVTIIDRDSEWWSY